MVFPYAFRRAECPSTCGSVEDGCPFLLRNGPLPVTLLLLLDVASQVVGGTTQLAALAAGALVVVVALLWFSRAWWRGLFGLGRNLARLNALEAAVKDMQRRSGVRPADLRIVHGAVWGRIGVGEEFHPFCPWCATKDTWTLLVREDGNGNESFRCISCHRHIPSGHLMPPKIR